jgi:hypothetical protein
MIRKLTLALLALAPLLALAEDQPAAPGGDETMTPEEAVPAAPLEGGAKAGEGNVTTAPPDMYTIRPGDTLWDLSGRFLNNPWYWPKIWSYNPDIANPHWIYPGNLLRFYPSGEEGGGEVVPVQPDEPVAETEEDLPAVRELEDVSKADMKAPISEEEKDTVSATGPIGFVQQRKFAARHDAFITRRELEESGTIRASFEEKDLLSARDGAYVSFKNPGAVKMGETYAIYRTLREVKHPITNEILGYQTEILGSGKVVAVDKTAVSIFITASYDAIERGDRLGPWGESAYRVVPSRPNAKEVRGVIVSSPVEQVNYFAQSQVVFVDRGKADGVEEGNRFTVVRAGDSKAIPGLVESWDPTLPVEDVGSLLVVDVKEHTSTALVTRSLRELQPGDRVEMRVAEK